jgi:flagellar hook-associated protein 2
MPVTLSGFNNIDFGSIVTALMTQARAPENALKTQQQNLQAQSGNLSTLATKLSALDTAAAALAAPQSLSGNSVTSTSSSALTFSAGSGTPQGTYEIKIQSLAHAQVTETSSTAPDADSTAVATGGTLTIGGVDVTVSGGTTLQGLADAINSTDGIGVTAAVVQSDTNQYALVLTGNETGSAASFTVQNNLSGGAGVTFNGTNATDASNARITVNNVTVVSSTNTFTNAVPGGTLNVFQAAPTTTVSVTVSQSTTQGESLINAFVTAYNDLVSFAQSQVTSANKNDGTSIGHDSVLRSINIGLQQILGEVNDADSTFQNLAAIGVGFSQTGQLTFDASAYEDAVSSGGLSHVQTLVSGNGTTDGVIQQVHETLMQYTSADGAVTSAQTANTTQVQNLTNQINSLEARLLIQQTSLQKEFAAADDAIARLNSQATSLSGLANQYSLLQNQ